jgi:hypothetical protein
MLSSSRSSLTSDQLDDLQSFLKDWLRHTGRTQADLRRALRASSIRMPVLLEELNRTYNRSGLDGLAQQLCGIEELWHQEDGWPAGDGGETDAAPGRLSLDDSLGQLDLLLEEIRLDQAS